MRKLSQMVKPKDRIIKLKGEIASLQWLLEELPNVDVAFVKNDCVMPVDSFVEEVSGDVKTFFRNYIKQSIELFESELQQLTKSENRRQNKIKYNGDGINTCRVCGKTLCFEAYDRENYVYKQKIKIRGNIKTVYYCGYNCRRKDEK